MADYQLFINGEYVDAQSGETFTTIDPGTGQPIAEIAKAGREDSVRAIEAARKAFDEGPWPRMSGAERGAKLNEIADAIEAKAGAFAEMEARDGGGTIKKATFADVPGAVGAFRWFAKLAIEEADEVEVPGTPFPPSQNWVRYEPHGVCTGIIPWNFPFIMAAWKLGPALAAGRRHLQVLHGCAQAGSRAATIRRGAAQPTGSILARGRRDRLRTDRFAR